MPKKVPNIQRIINNDTLKIVNIFFSSACPAVYGPACKSHNEILGVWVLLDSFGFPYLQSNLARTLPYFILLESHMFQSMVIRSALLIISNSSPVFPSSLRNGAAEIGYTRTPLRQNNAPISLDLGISNLMFYRYRLFRSGNST